MDKIQLIKDLRAQTGAGLGDVKEALEANDFDLEKAKEHIRKKGLAKADKRSDRETSQGTIATYLHNTGKVGSIVEVACETDFVAKSDDFVNFAREVALQVVALNPKHISEEEITDEVKDQLKSEIDNDESMKSKPEDVKEKILESKIKKYAEDYCLLNQKYIKDESQSIEDMLKALSAKVGEKVVIARFNRMEIGG